MRKEALCFPLSSLVLLSFSHFSLWFWGWSSCFGLGDLGFLFPLPPLFLRHKEGTLAGEIWELHRGEEIGRPPGPPLPNSAEQERPSPLPPVPRGGQELAQESNGKRGIPRDDPLTGSKSPRIPHIPKTHKTQRKLKHPKKSQNKGARPKFIYSRSFDVYENFSLSRKLWAFHVSTKSNNKRKTSRRQVDSAVNVRQRVTTGASRRGSHSNSGGKPFSRVTRLEPSVFSQSEGTHSML